MSMLGHPSREGRTVYKLPIDEVRCFGQYCRADRVPAIHEFENFRPVARKRPRLSDICCVTTTIADFSQARRKGKGGTDSRMRQQSVYTGSALTVGDDQMHVLTSIHA